MEVEYSGGGVLIFSYLRRKLHQLDNFGGFALSRGSLIRVSSWLYLQFEIEENKKEIEKENTITLAAHIFL